jgi:two-component system chemotaxis response regulator CheY
LSNSGLFRDIPVIILSGFEDPAKRKKCLELGARDYLLKPFEPQQLLEVVNNAVNEEQKVRA